MNSVSGSEGNMVKLGEALQLFIDLRSWTHQQSDGTCNTAITCKQTLMHMLLHMWLIAAIPQATLAGAIQAMPGRSNKLCASFVQRCAS